MISVPISLAKQEIRLKSRPVMELDLEKNKKTLKAVGKFSVNLLKGVVEGAVKGAVKGTFTGADSFF